jgi:glutathione S-transferase
MLTLYGMIDSGNCYKPRLLLAKLGRRFRNIEVSSHDGGTRKPDFTDKNPNAMVPLLEFEDGRLLAESNAMLLHLAEDTRFVPQDAYDRALAYQWLFFEQYSHEPYIAVRRALVSFPHRKAEATPERLQATLERGEKALRVMEKRLGEARFFAGSSYSVADIALYAYTHVAEEGGFDLAAYPEVRGWLKRVEDDPGHVPMEWLPGAAG